MITHRSLRTILSLTATVLLITLAGGAPHHPVTGQCVMDESLEAHHYSKVHPQWGEDDHEHLMDHINQIREHLNYPLY